MTIYKYRNKNIVMFHIYLLPLTNCNCSDTNHISYHYSDSKIKKLMLVYIGCKCTKLYLGQRDK